MRLLDGGDRKAGRDEAVRRARVEPIDHAEAEVAEVGRQVVTGQKPELVLLEAVQVPDRGVAVGIQDLGEAVDPRRARRLIRGLSLVVALELDM